MKNVHYTTFSFDLRLRYSPPPTLWKNKFTGSDRNDGWEQLPLPLLRSVKFNMRHDEGGKLLEYSTTNYWCFCLRTPFNIHSDDWFRMKYQFGYTALELCTISIRNTYMHMYMYNASYYAFVIISLTCLAYFLSRDYLSYINSLGSLFIFCFSLTKGQCSKR